MLTALMLLLPWRLCLLLPSLIHLPSSCRARVFLAQRLMRRTQTCISLDPENLGFLGQRLRTQGWVMARGQLVHTHH